MRQCTAVTRCLEVGLRGGGIGNGTRVQAWLQGGEPLRQCRTALLLSVWQREVKIEGFHLQGVLRQCAAVTRCLEVGDVGEGSVTAPGVKHG